MQWPLFEANGYADLAGQNFFPPRPYQKASPSVDSFVFL